MKKYSWAASYAIVLIGFTVFVVLDTFVIPKVGVVVEKNSSNIGNNSNPENNHEKDATITDTSYEDSNITIRITTTREYDTDIYIVDIKLSSIDYLKTAFANNTYGRNITATTSSIASSNNAVLAINGDYYGFRNSGVVVRNGVTYRSSSRGSDSEDLVIYNDGTFDVIDENSSDINTLIEKGALQIFSFGPALLKDGALAVNENTEVQMSKASNPRTAIGMIDTLHYVMIISDGRTDESEGLSLYELALQFEKLGCTIAYNLDGGGSSTLWFNGNVVNNPTDGNSLKERKVSDIIYVGYE